MNKECTNKSFSPDWNNYQQGRKDALHDAAEYCRKHQSFADSTMDHEELLEFVAKAILRL